MVSGTWTNKIERSRPWLRQLVAVACAIAVVWVSLVHSFQHSAAVGTAAGVEVAVVALDDSPDAPEPTATGDHCHGCVAVGIAVEAPVAATVVVSAAPDGVVRDLLRRSLFSETPPPKSMT